MSGKIIVREIEAPTEEELAELAKWIKKFRIEFMIYLFPVLAAFAMTVKQINIMFPANVNFKWKIFLERYARHKTDIFLTVLLVICISIFAVYLIIQLHDILKFDGYVERYKEQHKFAKEAKNIAKVMYIERGEYDFYELHYVQAYKHHQLKIPDYKMRLGELQEDTDIVIDFEKHKIYSAEK